MKIKKMVIAALLTALAIVIPYAVFFKVIIPPFTATLGSHVPMFIAMLLGPKIAIMVGLGSAIGFLLNFGSLVGARALMHVFVGLVGARFIKKCIPFWIVILITAPIHGLLEVLVVIPFINIDVYKLLVVTGVGTILHHCVDGFISYIIVNVLKKTHEDDIFNINTKKQTKY